MTRLKASQSIDPVRATALYSRSDLYSYESLLTEKELALLGRLRTFLDQEARPLLNDYWERAETPIQLRRPMAELNLASPPELCGDGAEPRHLFVGFRNFELARTDSSVGILYNGQVGMFRTLVREGGSREQAAEWDPLITSFEMTGAFALTEPEHGSDVARGLSTTARRVGNKWVLNGTKRWIGNAAFSEYIIIMARDVADGEVKAFMARSDAPGMQLEKIERKISLRMVNNSDILITDVEVDESYRLQNINSFSDVNAILRSLRPDVAWNAAGLQAGAYEAALEYVLERQQFGRPLASFQLTQEKLVRMLGNVTASLGMAVRLAQLRESGIERDEDSAMAKTWICDRMRETVALAREVVGGNGITLDAGVARFFTDAESLYSYEGSREINTLIVGRAITGYSAFVN
ncbi:acyl-CoA dehydrogenase family protein [Pseudarthrobacter sp. NPDC058329]|uniref:acyl-CoA dehydrogenase family protein n=1 Tax=Pseudarthrobacter sp. NPDC058329 TaxID=3346448 RepID=UPI0036DE9348